MAICDGPKYSPSPEVLAIEKKYSTRSPNKAIFQLKMYKMQLELLNLRESHEFYDKARASRTRAFLCAEIAKLESPTTADLVAKHVTKKKKAA